MCVYLAFKEAHTANLMLFCIIAVVLQTLLIISKVTFMLLIRYRNGIF